MQKSNVQSGLVGLVAMLLVAPAGADVSVTISSAGAYRNQVVDVFVILMGEGSPAADDFNPPIPTGMNLDLVYPTNVITTPSCFLDPDLAGLGFRLSTSEDIPGGRVRLLIYGPLDELWPEIPDGTVAVCSATVKPDAPYGSHPLQVEMLAVSNKRGNRIPATWSAGNLRVLGGGGTCSTVGVGSVAEFPVALLIAVVLAVVRGFRSGSRLRRSPPALVAVLCFSGMVEAQVITPAAGSPGIGIPSIAITGRLEPVDGAEQTPDASGARSGGSPKAALERLGLPSARPTATPRWHVWDLQIEGNKIRGRVAFMAANFLRHGRFEARVSSRGAIHGVLYNGDGSKVGTFRGRIRAEALWAYVKTSGGQRARATWSRAAEGGS